ncbi:hypothetical protein EV424DRAFT_1346353 [Suillus variegatus]|nr:hypothetical protein EV424DRAFT_1346353 [Suillus variegatus]
MAQAITEIFMTYGALVTVLSPLILSAAAKLQEHMDSNNSGISSPPAIPSSPPHSIMEVTLGYRPLKPAPQKLLPCLLKNGVISKKQCGKSRAIITTDDELDEDSDEVAPLPTKPKVADPPSRKSDQYVEVTTKDKMDADEECVIMVTPKMGTKKITNFSGTVLMEDEFADTSAPTWAPHCGQCMACDLICCQGFNKNNGRTLKAPTLPQPKASPRLPAERVPSPGAALCRYKKIQLQMPAALVEEEPVPFATPVVANPKSSQMLDDPKAAGPSSILPPSCVAHEQEMEALKLEVARLCWTVEVLVAQVVAGDQLLQAAYTCLDAQDNCTDLLASKIADIHRLINPPSSVPPTDIAADESDELAAGPANDMEDLACLLITIKTPEAEDSNVSGELAM